MSVTTPNYKEQLAFRGKLYQSFSFNENVAGQAELNFLFRTPPENLAILYGIDFTTQDGRAKLEAFVEANDIIDDGIQEDNIFLNGFIIDKPAESKFFRETVFSPTQTNPNYRRVSIDLAGDEKRSGTSFDTESEVAVLRPNVNYRLKLTNYETTPIKVLLRIVFGETPKDKAIYLGRDY